MAILGFELEEIARLIALVEAQGLEELHFKEGDRSLRIRGPRREKATVRVLPSEESAVRSPARIRPTSPLPALESSAAPALPAAPQIVLTSPMVGVFYRAEKPGAPPLVHEGDRIEVGQVVGILEAMKVFSEFKSEHAGVIVSIPVADGQLVQTGTTLMILQEDGTGAN